MITYEPGPSLERCLESAARQVARLIVVDNHSSPSAWREIERVTERHRNVEVTRLGRNVGIAAALNRGFIEARATGATWVLTLDQDTRLPADAVAILSEVASSLAMRDDPHVAIVAPAIDYVGKPSHDRRVSRSAACERRTVITSGNLVRFEAYDAVGGFDGRLFIDSVDFDFCLRLAEHKYTIYESPRVRIEHALGTVRTKRFLGLRLTYTSYNAQRRYYQFRNRTYLYARYWRRFPRWVASDAVFMMADIFKTLVLEADPAAMRSAFGRGVIDGLRRRLS